MSLELLEILTLRDYRLEASYTAVRLSALPETRHLAPDYEEASAQIARLEEEEAELEIQRVQTQAMVEIADDDWDDTMEEFQRRLLDAAGHSVDHEIYRRYFAEIPSHVTSMSYAAEIMISQDLEADLGEETHDDLRAFSERLRGKRLPLEAALRERTRLEVEMAKFENRASLAKALLNKLRRVSFANLEEIAVTRDRGRDWCWRFFRSLNPDLEQIDMDGVEERFGPQNGELEAVAPQ